MGTKIRRLFISSLAVVSLVGLAACEQESSPNPDPIQIDQPFEAPGTVSASDAVDQLSPVELTEFCNLFDESIAAGIAPQDMLDAFLAGWAEGSGPGTLGSQVDGTDVFFEIVRRCGY